MSTVILWELLCVALFYSVFCRSVRVNKTTSLDIRLALWALGIASLVGLGAPVYGWKPDVVSLILLASIVLVQAATAQHWGVTVPQDFVADKFKHHKGCSGDSQ